MTTPQSPQTTTTVDAFVNKYLPCPDSMCDGQGTTIDGTTDDPYPAQCQYCYEVRMPAVLAIAALIRDAHKQELNAIPHRLLHIPEVLEYKDLRLKALTEEEV